MKGKASTYLAKLMSGRPGMGDWDPAGQDVFLEQSGTLSPALCRHWVYSSCEVVSVTASHVAPERSIS